MHSSESLLGSCRRLHTFNSSCLCKNPAPQNNIFIGCRTILFHPRERRGKNLSWKFVLTKNKMQFMKRSYMTRFLYLFPYLSCCSKCVAVKFKVYSETGADC